MIKEKSMITVVIPARMASSRYPGKPLVPISGLPLVEHVRRRSLLATGVDNVVVATCDESIREMILSFGGQSIMTKNTHERCTDRVEEAMQVLRGDIVAMVQGDEPLIVPETVNKVVQPLMEDSSLNVVNILSHLESDKDYTNQNIVKAVCNLKGEVIFFTRAPVPFFREQEAVPVFRQTGIMAFRTQFLHQFSVLPETALERVESVDMLRVIEHGIRIKGVVVDYITLGVDRPCDVAAVENALENDPVQKSIFDQILNMEYRK